MNIKYLKKLAKNNPALARAINIWILWSIATYISLLIIEFWTFWDYWQILIPLFTSIWAYIDKRIRDLSKE